MGAKCRNCQTNVGCGCNLKDGLCSYCQAEMKKNITITPKPQEQNVESKTDELSRMW